LAADVAAKVGPLGDICIIWGRNVAVRTPLQRCREISDGREPPTDMAFRDTWHGFLVYFGLAEDEAYEDDVEPYSEPEVHMQDTYRDRPTVRRLSARPSRRRDDDWDDIFADEGGQPERRTTTLRSVGRGNGRSGGGDVRVHFVPPKNFNDAQDIADKFKESIPVIINLQNADSELSKRLIDFASGLTYALDGGMQRIADKVFMLTPHNVEVSAEERAKLIEKGFFNQS
jgi:cell division inhibitor SepF